MVASSASSPVLAVTAAAHAPLTSSRMLSSCSLPGAAASIFSLYWTIKRALHGQAHTPRPGRRAMSTPRLAHLHDGLEQLGIVDALLLLQRVAVHGQLEGGGGGSGRAAMQH